MRFYYFRPFANSPFPITTALSHNETKFNHHDGIYSHRLILHLGSLLKLHLTAGQSGLARQAYRQTLILSPKSDSPLVLIILHRDFNELQLPRRITWSLLSSVCTLPSSSNSDTPVYTIATRKHSERISSIGSAKMRSHGIIGHCYPRILSALGLGKLRIR